MKRLFLYVSMCLIGISSAAFSADTDRDGLPDDWETANRRGSLVADYMVSAVDNCVLDDGFLAFCSGNRIR